MTPDSSMTLTATSSVRSPAVSGPANPAPGPLGPNPSDVMASYAAALWRLLWALQRITIASTLTPRRRAQRAKCTSCTHFCHDVHSMRLRRDEGRQRRSDVLAHHQVGDVVEFGRFAVDDAKPRPVAFGHERESRGRPYDQRRADGEKEVARERQLL